MTTIFQGKGISTGATNGWHGEKVPHILTYLPRGMPYAAFFPITVRSLTVWTRIWFVLRYVGWTMWAGLVGAVLAVIKIDGLAEDILPIFQDGITQFRTVTAFVIGGFALQAVGAWKERRTNYASLCGSIRNLVLQLASLLPIPEDGAKGELAETRRTLGRWTILAYELAVLKARGAMDSPEAQQFLLSKGLLLAGEWERMVPGDRHTTVLFWVQALFKRCVDQGHTSLLELQLVANAVRPRTDRIYRRQYHNRDHISCGSSVPHHILAITPSYDLWSPVRRSRSRGVRPMI